MCENNEEIDEQSLGYGIENLIVKPVKHAFRPVLDTLTSRPLTHPEAVSTTGENM
jgi:hypothetical protein